MSTLYTPGLASAGKLNGTANPAVSSWSTLKAVFFSLKPRASTFTSTPASSSSILPLFNSVPVACPFLFPLQGNLDGASSTDLNTKS